MLFPKTILLALLPFFIGANAHPSGNTNVDRANDAPIEAAAPIVKRQDDGGDDTYDLGLETDTDNGTAAQYEQCGGVEFGTAECEAPYSCQYQNDYYSQCL